MKLECGLYKVSDRKKPFPTMYLLRVFMKDGKKYYQLNNELPQAVDKYGIMYLEGFQLVKRIHRPVQVTRGRITVTWYDEQEDRYETTMSNIQVLKRLFLEFPEIAAALGARLRSHDKG